MRFPEQYRDRRGTSRIPPSEPGDPFGFFIVLPSPAQHRPLALRCMASSGAPPEIPWEHVSVSTPVRCPTWEEMCFVKSLFWLPHECVVQFHPPEAEYVNQHPYCLHLWRPLEPLRIPRPPTIAVGVLG